MKFVPILFSTPMVQAILEGRKDVTRRVIKSRHESGMFAISKTLKGEVTGITSIDWDEGTAGDTNDIQPKWQEGDILWVRETWQTSYNDKKDKWDYIYKADGYYYDDDGHTKWKPSIFMPKQACRLFLEVVSVRPERLQDITPDEACSEGIEYWNIDHEALKGGELQADFKNYTWTEKKEADENYTDRWFPTFANPIDSFRTLWQSINGEESWNSNPWIWRIAFKKIERPVSFINPLSPNK